jgi:ribosomal protein S18 acetylase RimI-like enzyme
MPPGAEIADAYVELMLVGCREWKGTFFVAEVSGRVAGFVCVWSKYRSDEPHEGPKEYGLVTDLVVVPAARGKGLGRALLEQAEAFAKKADVRWLRVGVLSSNRGARALYSTAGYRPYLEYLEKELGGGESEDG